MQIMGGKTRADLSRVQIANNTRSVLTIGNFLSGAGCSRGVCEDLAERLAADGWEVITASGKRPRLFRLADMVMTAVKHRHKYGVAQVDVYSGPAFFWAEAVCWTLRRLGKPYVLTLHGGNLPEFAKRWPGRVGRLLRSARVVTAPSAYLKEQFPDVQLTMVGPDKGDGSFQRVQAEVAAAGLADRVMFRDQVAKKEVPQVLAQGDIFLNTATVDNSPVSVVEAMACGLCVVSTRVGGIPFLVDHGKDGLLVEPGNVDSMTFAVARFLTDEGLARSCSHNGREKVQKWDWSLMLAEWDMLLRKVLQNSV